MAEKIDDHIGLERSYVNLTDAVMMLGRPPHTTSSWPSWPCGNADGPTPIAPSTMESHWLMTPLNFACGSARRACGHRRSWRHSRVPAAIRVPSTSGLTGPRASSSSLDARRTTPQRSRRTPPEGWPWPRPSTTAPAVSCGRRRARRPCPLGTGSTAPPLAAFCRWREAEALVADGASRTQASVPLRDAHAVAARLGARPLLREIDMWLSGRAWI
jgi:hypothetical protein